MSFSKNLFFQILTQIGGIISGLVVSILTARLLGTYGRGEFAIFITSFNFITVLSSLSIGFSIVYLISSNKFQLNKIIYSSLLITLIIIILNILILGAEYVFDTKLLYDNNSFLGNSLMLVCFSISLFNSILNAIFAGLKLFNIQQIAAIIFSLLSIILYFLFYYLIDSSNPNALEFNEFLIFFTLIIFISFLTNLFYLKKYAISNIKGSGSGLKPEFLDKKQTIYLLLFSSTAYFANLIQVLSYKIDFSFVDYFLGKDQLGIYSLSVNLARLIWLLPVAISTILVPYSAGDLNSAIKLTNKISRISLFCVVCLIICLLPISGFLITFIYGNAFSASTPIFQLLLIGYIPFIITNIITGFFCGRGLIKYNLLLSFILLFFTSVGNYLLLPILGVIGGALASGFTFTMGFIVVLIIYKKHTKSTLSEIILIQKEDIEEIWKKTILLRINHLKKS